ncbi:tissue factor isoform X2 [Ascaphus truei]|uniref:tissue factor isoform X2 n=1 Tax=Ascaphus truei TaxID=8439 RepID=UPI003F59E59F
MCSLSLLLQAAVCFSVLCWHRAPATDELYFMTAVNIKWSSINFKTILEWQPVPTNHSYTVEVSGSGKKPDWKTKCLYTMSTECDVTDLLDNPKDTYHAKILSTIPPNSDFWQHYPFSVSPPFVPYEETIIGKPGIGQYKLHKENDTLQVTIVDPLTPYRFPNNSLQSIRDIFKDDLRYTVYFWKASSTGKKSATTQSNEFVIRVDKGESYCFYVQATIMSRKLNRESQQTETHCTTNGDLPTAVNIKWSSINFKTILEWQPEPTNYSYTVEVSGKKSDWKTKCIYTMSTECDVTDLLDNLKDTYHAQIVSTIQANKDTTEVFPFSVSPPFVPYEETIIGKPGIGQYKLHKENDTLQVTIVDPLTPYRFSNNSLQSIRDIFKDDLRYTVYFWEASSTGKKSATTQSNELVIRVDKGESYCFYVQATIMSRKVNRESQESEAHCTTNKGRVPSGVYSSIAYLYLCSTTILYILL